MNGSAFDIPDDEGTPVVEGEVVEPAALIPYETVLSRLEGITAADKLRAVALGHRATSIVRIDNDTTEEEAGHLIDEMTEHKAVMEKKINPLSDLANKLHKALTGFRSVATQELVLGLDHLRPLLAKRLSEKKAAEEARQREARELAQKQERERLLAEAVHAEQTGSSEEEVQQIVREAEHVVAPAVAARPITPLTNVSTRENNWKALPAHADDWGDMKILDYSALITFLAEQIAKKDYAYIGLLQICPTVANQLARAQKEAFSIPGLRAVNPPALVRRGRS